MSQETHRVKALRCLVERYGSIEEAFIAAHHEQGLPEGALGALHDYRDIYLGKGIIPSFIVAHYNVLFPNGKDEKPPRVVLLAAE